MNDAVTCPGRYERPCNHRTEPLRQPKQLGGDACKQTHAGAYHAAPSLTTATPFTRVRSDVHVMSTSALDGRELARTLPRQLGTD